MNLFNLRRLSKSIITSNFIWMTIAARRNNQLSSDHQINKLTYAPSNSKQKYTNYKMVSIFNIFHKISHIPIPIILIQLVVAGRSLRGHHDIFIQRCVESLLEANSQQGHRLRSPPGISPPFTMICCHNLPAIYNDLLSHDRSLTGGHVTRRDSTQCWMKRSWWSRTLRPVTTRLWKGI